MKISYNHIRSLLKDSPTVSDVSERLFQLGHENSVEKDIFDIEFTPNRGDCLSLLGITRDLNVFYKTKLDFDIYKKNIQTLDLDFNNYSDDKCPKISFLNIKVKNKKSKYKNYLERYFRDLENNKVNFFTDISNYLAYELGQPTHAYDFTKIKNNQISLCKNKSNETFKTITGSKIKVDPNDLVFTNNNKIINLSGIMGGEDTACDQNTNNALIECAFFEPEAILGKAIKYNLQSDSSYKFERGVDISIQEYVLRRFIKIVEDHAEVSHLSMISYEYTKPETKKVYLDLDDINKIIGIKLDNKELENILHKLQFKIEKNYINIPFHRNDISSCNDIAEEVARTIGYDNIPREEFIINKSAKVTKNDKMNSARSFLIDNGFYEVINSPFTSKNNNNSIKIDNPLDKNRSYLRTNIKDSLLNNLLYNEKRQKDCIKFFEISDVYSLNKKNEIHKDKKISIIVSGRRGHNYIEFSKKLDRKYLKNLFNNIDIENKIEEISRNDLDHKSKSKSQILFLELDFDEFFNICKGYKSATHTKKGFVTYNPVSEFPESHRDLSFSIKNPSNINDLVSIVSQIKSEILKSAFIFDFYKNKETKENKIGYRFIFQSKNRTLNDNEIDKVMNEIIQDALRVESVSIPGI